MGRWCVLPQCLGGGFQDQPTCWGVAGREAKIVFVGQLNPPGRPGHDLCCLQQSQLDPMNHGAATDVGTLGRLLDGMDIRVLELGTGAPG